MTTAAAMPTHGGLVPLGLTHSISQFIYIPNKNTTISTCLQGKCYIFLSRKIQNDCRYVDFPL